MLVGLISDTHGYVDPRIPSLFRHVDRILHAGDIGSEAVLEQLARIAPLIAVRGNADLHLAAVLPERANVELDGVGVHLVHRREDAMPPPGTAVVVYGHTHRAQTEQRDGITWVNPGAAGRQGFHRVRTAALMRVNAGTPEPEIVTLGPRGI